MLKLLGLYFVIIQSKITFDPKTAVKRFMTIPMLNVRAKPLIGPVPKIKRKSAVISVVTWASITVSHALVVTAIHSSPDSFSKPQFLSYPFKDDDIRIDTDTHGKDDTCNAGQGHGEFEHTEDTEKINEVQKKGDVGNYTG